MPWLHPLVFVTGACVLVIEILGTRVISPLFGATVYVWSALITVTLAALAFGYAAGGALADRGRPLRALAAMLGVAGLWVLLLPLLDPLVLARSARLGLRAGALASASFLFAVPLFALGAVGPIAVRLNTRDISRVGREAGSVSALSTAGSVLGALLAGFWLIPLVAVSKVFLGLGAVLVAASAWCWTRTDVRSGGAIAAAVTVTATALAALGLRAPAPRPGVVAHVQGLYGDLQVVEHDGLRSLYVDGITNSEIDLATGESTSDYVAALELLPFFHPEAKRALLIGLGGGLLVKSFHQHYGIATDVLEIDPDMEPLARRWFGFEPSGDDHLEDGRRFLRDTSEKYDLVVLDAFNGDQHPYHLFSREAFALMAERLAPHGILAMNVIGYTSGPKAGLLGALGRTLEQVFPHVRVMVANGGFNPLRDRYANLILLASKDPIELRRDPATARPFLASFWSHLDQPFAEIPPGGALITDDQNPIESLSAPAFLALRTRLIRRGR